MLTPLLSEEDPVASSEGSLDPLGLYQIADALAVRLVPGVRERQIHPRFLTAIAASLAVCQDFNDDVVASDRVSPPWQVFEWYAVEGLVRTVSDTAQLRGVPGRAKAAEAIQDGVPLSARRYLKTPTVFGFHGVYRTLSDQLGVEVVSRLGETGYELLSVWSEEQGLHGFCGTTGGVGADWRRKLSDAVKDGLAAGAAARGGGWSGWDFFAQHLLPRNPGRKECQSIRRMLVGPDGQHRRVVLEFLISRAGQDVWKTTESERRFHEALSEHCDEQTADLLRAIMTYETFARRLQDAIDDCLHCMSRTRSKTPPSEFASFRSVSRAAADVPELFDQLVDLLAPYQQSVNLQTKFADLASRLNAEDWVEQLLEHHKQNQLNKPPNGKLPWFERFDDGSCIIRPNYIRSSGGQHDDEYVHYYRTIPLWSFASDLRMVR